MSAKAFFVVNLTFNLNVCFSIEKLHLVIHDIPKAIMCVRIDFGGPSGILGTIVVLYL